ncbi:MAG: helix-turn-helix domain-containing protein [Cryobacterium sp.]
MPNDIFPLPARSPISPAVSALVQACLADIDLITSDFMEEIQKIEGYSGGAVPAAELRDTAAASLELVLRLIGGLPLPERLVGISEKLGARRAQQGVPLESLLLAVRLDFRLLWMAMGRRVPVGTLPTFTEDAILVWDAVEFHTIRVHSGYLNELASMARQVEHQRAFLLDRLLALDGADPNVLVQAARALNVDPFSSFLVAVASAHQQDKFRGAARRAGAQKYLHERDGALVLILECVEGEQPAPPVWLLGLPCAVAPVAGDLASVPRMLRIASDAAAAIGAAATSMVTIRDVWGHVAASRLGDFGRELAHSVLDGLSDAPPQERRRLIETLHAYFNCGSVSAAAAALFCHRNTVLNRLGRFADLTGLDPTRPREAAVVLVAFDCAARTPDDFA